MSLSARIHRFLDRHAKIAADYDPEIDAPGERFNGPDSALLHAAAVALEHGQQPPPVRSSWTSGCYRGDASARAEHDALVILIDQRR
jgi:hypothetical protein